MCILIRVIKYDQNKTQPKLLKQEKHVQETKPQYSQSLGCDKTMFRQFLVFKMLPNLRKQISIIYFLSILKISQPKDGLCFILVTLYYIPYIHFLRWYVLEIDKNRLELPVKQDVLWSLINLYYTYLHIEECYKKGLLRFGL